MNSIHPAGLSQRSSHFAKPRDEYWTFRRMVRPSSHHGPHGGYYNFSLNGAGDPDVITYPYKNCECHVLRLRASSVFRIYSISLVSPTNIITQVLISGTPTLLSSSLYLWPKH